LLLFLFQCSFSLPFYLYASGAEGGDIFFMNAALALRFLPFAFFFAISISPLNVRSANPDFFPPPAPRET